MNNPYIENLMSLVKKAEDEAMHFKRTYAWESHPDVTFKALKPVINSVFDVVAGVTGDPHVHCKNPECKGLLVQVAQTKKGLLGLKECIFVGKNGYYSGFFPSTPSEISEEDILNAGLKPFDLLTGMEALVSGIVMSALATQPMGKA